MEKAHGVRIGPSSLVTLIAALLLAVLAMLCATSAHAQSTLANREAQATTETYAIDSCGHRALAAIDEKLKSTNRLSQSDADDIAATAQAQSDEDLSVSAIAQGSLISITVSAPSGKTLNALMNTQKGKATITEWKFITVQDSNTETLWTN